MRKQKDDYMGGMLTQEDINQLCSVIVDEVCEVSVKEWEKIIPIN